MFDSLGMIHQDHPDTGVLRRLHPPADTIMFVEGSSIERFTGDSLFRRVLNLHATVRMMSQRFSQRTAGVMGAVFSGLYEWTGTVWLAMILHVLIDAFAGQVALATRRPVAG